MFPLVEQASAAYPRTDTKLLNKGQNALVSNLGIGGDQDAYQRLVGSINSVVPVYSQIMQRGGVPTVSSQEHARELLDPSFGHERMMAGLKQLQKEIEQVQGVTGAVRERRRGGAPEPSQSFDGFSIERVQ